MKKLLILLLPVLLAACATVQPIKVDVPTITQSDKVAVSDARPATENERELFSLMITSEQYGLSRLPALQMEPSAIRLLQHRVYEKLGAQGPVTLKINHLVVYQNMKHQLRSGVMFGVVGAAFANRNNVDGLSSVIDPARFAQLSGDDEWKRATFTEQENPDEAAVLIVWLDAEINGKRVAVRTLSPLKQPEGKVPYVVALESAYGFLLKQYAPA